MRVQGPLLGSAGARCRSMDYLLLCQKQETVGGGGDCMHILKPVYSIFSFLVNPKWFQWCSVYDLA